MPGLNEYVHSFGTEPASGRSLRAPRLRRVPSQLGNPPPSGRPTVGAATARVLALALSFSLVGAEGLAQVGTEGSPADPKRGLILFSGPYELTHGEAAARQLATLLGHFSFAAVEMKAAQAYAKGELQAFDNLFLIGSTVAELPTALLHGRPQWWHDGLLAGTGVRSTCQRLRPACQVWLSSCSGRGGQLLP